MKIKLKKIGFILTSRQSGREAFLAVQPKIKEISKKEHLVIDFKGIKVLSPSWADEFFTPLFQKFKKRLVLKNIQNLSAQKTIEFLEKTNDIEFNIEKNKKTVS